MLERVQQITYHGFPKNLYEWSCIIDGVSFFSFFSGILSAHLNLIEGGSPTFKGQEYLLSKLLKTLDIRI
jgi:hypothetical protein